MTVESTSQEMQSFAPIPYAPGHPVLGHLREFRNDRVGMLLRFAREWPDIARFRVGFLRGIMIGAPALAHEVLQVKHSSFVKGPGIAIFLRPVLGNGLLTSEHEVHARQRKIIAPAFAHKRTAGYAPAMADLTARFTEALPDGGVLDVAKAMMALTLEIVGKVLFDAEVGSDADEVGDALTIAMETALAQISALVPVPPSIPTPTNLRNRRAVERLDAIVYRLIRARREQGGDRGDLLSMLLGARYEDGSAMTDRQLRDEAMALFLGGHETTANALAWTLYLLAKNPLARARLEAEVDALGRVPSSSEDLKRLPWTLAVFKESMRLYPPVFLAARRATEDVAIGGHQVKKGNILLINVLGIHRRPDAFPDPERFDPERFMNDAERELPRCAFMPFGVGPRTCIGGHFSMMEGQVVLAGLLRRVRLDLVSTALVEPEPLVTLRPRGAMDMRVTVRRAAARAA